MKHELYRSRSDRMIAGVCAGIAEYFEIDPTVVRLLAVLGSFVSFGAVAVAYVVMAIVVPEAPESGVYAPSPERASAPPPPAAPAPPPAAPVAPAAVAPPPPSVPMAPADAQSYPAAAPPVAQPATREPRSGRGGLIAGIVVLVLGLALLAGQFLPGFDVWQLWPLILVAIGFMIIIRGGRR
jgi:phage shock protein PspC (stress-responsive transcriptional regulator)